MLKTQKNQLRKRILSILEKLDPENVVTQSQHVTEQITSTDWFRDARRISIYVSTGKEINTDEIIRKAIAIGKSVFIPRFTKGVSQMEMLQLPSIEDYDNLIPYLWGIRQPEQDCQWPSYHQLGPLDVVLLPGVAFNEKNGHRLGHGKAFYDRFLMDHRHRFERYPRMVALALKEQLVDDVPMDQSDVTMDMVMYGDGETR